MFLVIWRDFFATIDQHVHSFWQSEVEVSAYVHMYLWVGGLMKNKQSVHC